ncbi:MAG: phosphate ABC transporter permease PstA [Pseudomonadota bacterium]
MVDMTALTAIHTTDAAARRVKLRRRAEVRLKFYGLFVIGLATAALLVLMWSVFSRATGALTEHYATLPVNYASEKIDQEDPTKGKYSTLTKNTMKEAFPYVEGRKPRKALYGLLSSGAPFELNDATIADPSLLGTQGEFRFLLSDDADLYFKGFFGELDSRSPAGALTTEGEIGEVGETIEAASTAGDFSDELEQVKAQLLVMAERVRADAARQDNGSAVFAERLAAETDAEKIEELQAEVDRYAAQRDRLLAMAEDLTARGMAYGGDEALSDETLSLFVETGGGWLRATQIRPDSITAEVASPLSSADTSGWTIHVMETPASARKVSDAQVIWLEQLENSGAISSNFNWRFFSAGDSREAEQAGVWGAIVGSFWTMLVTFFLAFPLGVMAAIYLEEFAPKNRFTDFVEVNINNLAAVPSIIFGLLGLSIFVAGLEFDLWGAAFTIGGFTPRSAPIAGGMVLALMTLPTIIIAARAAIMAVPPSIRDAALGVGASKQQATFHHVLPLAMPGILTGSIIGMARALGETAPLIMIGMVAFIVDIPKGVTDSATVLPVQIYRWSDFPERAFDAKTALAICVLLAFLLIMNIIAIVLRKRFERRW